MNPETMAQANWRLENPPPVDVAVSRNMGLFVVGRLAARHGVKVRLQAAATGGLTALVWLPDAVVVLPEAGGAAGPGPAEPDAMASSARPAPTPEDVRALQPVASGPPAGPGLRPRHARPVLRLRAPVGPGLRPRHARPALRAAGARLVPGSRLASGLQLVRGAPPARGQPSSASPAAADRPVPGGRGSGVRRSTGDRVHRRSGDRRSGHGRSQVNSGACPSTRRSSRTGSPVQRQANPASAGSADAGWGSPADSGWDAAKTVLAPASERRDDGRACRCGSPRANLVPGAAGRAAARPGRPGQRGQASRPGPVGRRGQEPASRVPARRQPGTRGGRRRPGRNPLTPNRPRGAGSWPLDLRLPGWLRSKTYVRPEAEILGNHPS